MICPYNGFKEMDCRKCAAYIRADALDNKGHIFKEVCALAWNGAHVHQKPLLAIPAADRIGGQ